MTRHAHQDILDAVDLERLAAECISRLNTRTIAFGQGGLKGHKTIWRHWRPLADGLCLRRLSDSKKGHWVERQILRLLEERQLHGRIPDKAHWEKDDWATTRKTIERQWMSRSNPSLWREVLNVMFACVTNFSPLFILFISSVTEKR